MAITGTIYLTGELAGVPEGTRKIALSWSITAGVNSVVAGLSSGNNTIAIPSGAKLAILIPPAGNTTQIVLKQLAGDLGAIALHNTDPAIISLGNLTASFVLNAAGSIAGYEVYFA